MASSPALWENSRIINFILKGALYFATEELGPQGMAGFSFYRVEFFSEYSLYPLGCGKALIIAIED